MRHTIVIMALSLGIATPLWGDRIDLPQEQLEQNAPYIVVGQVVSVNVLDVQVPDEKFSPSHRRGNVDRHFRYTIRIDEVEKSRGDLEPGQLIDVEAWRLLHRSGGIFATIGYQGHRPLPAKGDLVRVYLQGGRRTFQPLDPNGFAAAAGGQLAPPLPPGKPKAARQPWESGSGRRNLIPGLAGFVTGVLVAGFAFQLRQRRQRAAARSAQTGPRVVC